MTTERRIFNTEFRDVRGSGGRQKWATAVAYNVVDSYRTIWRPHVFDKALGERMPVVLFGHDWTNLDHVLGRGIDFRQTPATVGPPGVDVLMEFADVPAAELAMKLLAPKATSRGAVLTDVSVGFERRKWVTRNALSAAELELGAEEAMVEAGMDELSLVIAGAVPGAMVRRRNMACQPSQFEALLLDKLADAAIRLGLGVNDPAYSEDHRYRDRHVMAECKRALGY